MTLTRKKFGKVNIEISNICNLQCSFCPGVIRPKTLMSTDLFARVIEQVAPVTEQVCLHLMGDPLVHPRLADFIDICEQHDARIFFVTNGVLLREKNADLLLRPSLRQVNFSLHSFADNYGNRDPGTYLERIFTFTERAFKERPDLYVNYRLWNLAEPRGGLDSNRRILAAIENTFGLQIPNEVDVRQNKSFPIRQRLYLHSDTEFTWPGLDLPVLGTSGRCYGLSSHIGVLADGTVVPCCLDKEGAIPLGNLASASLAEILESERAQAMRRGFQERRLVEDLCQRCQYIKRFKTS